MINTSEILLLLKNIYVKYILNKSGDIVGTLEHLILIRDSLEVNAFMEDKNLDIMYDNIYKTEAHILMLKSVTTEFKFRVYEYIDSWSDLILLLTDSISCREERFEKPTASVTPSSTRMSREGKNQYFHNDEYMRLPSKADVNRLLSQYDWAAVLCLTTMIDSFSEDDFREYREEQERERINALREKRKHERNAFNNQEE